MRSKVCIYARADCWDSGRTLGGSTSINGAAYTRGAAAQYDALSTLLESSDADMNWNFNSLFSYMKKVHTLLSISPCFSTNTHSLRSPKHFLLPIASKARRAQTPLRPTMVPQDPCKSRSQTSCTEVHNNPLLLPP